jgi:hypothetical protein
MSGANATPIGRNPFFLCLLSPVLCLLWLSSGLAYLDVNTIPTSAKRRSWLRWILLNRGEL